ncbi:MAG: hypothetical protein O2779_04825 [Nanoarchaeota archaeon]|nr:hypothetical protein [Nanoarchaeota archaeon]
MERNLRILLIIAVISVVISGAITFMGIQTNNSDQQSAVTDQIESPAETQFSKPPATVGGVVTVTIT